MTGEEVAIALRQAGWQEIETNDHIEWKKDGLTLRDMKEAYIKEFGEPPEED